jgi:hypothetical protein
LQERKRNKATLITLWSQGRNVLLDCVIFTYYLTHLELFVAFSKVNNQFVSSFKHDSIIKETRGGNSNFDVIL